MTTYTLDDVRKMGDGKSYSLGDVQAMQPSFMDDVAQQGKNLFGGAVRGAGSIGATILSPLDMAKDVLAGKGLSLESNRQRRSDMDSALRNLGVNTDSFSYDAGKLGSEVAGTLGAGGIVGKGVRALSTTPRAMQIANAISSGGFATGSPLAKAAPFSAKVADLALRSAGGGINGAVSAGMINPSDAGTGAMIGGAFPVVTKSYGTLMGGAGKLLAGKPLTQDVKVLAERASALGIDIPADRLANSKPLNAIASGLNYVPFSGRSATEGKIQNQLNKALTRTFGQDSDNVTMALRKADDSLGGEFDRVLQSNKVKLDEPFLQNLVTAESRAQNELGSEGARIIKNQIEEILAKGTSGEIDGQAAYNIKRTLDRIGKRNSPEAFYANDLKRDLMGALNRSLGPKEAASFASTRQQYGNMLELRKLAQNGADGDVSIARIANLKNINNPELQELADISAQFLKPREGQHGAAQRALAALGIGSFAGIAPLASSMVAGRLANTVLNSNLARKGILGEQLTIPMLEDLYKAAPILGINAQ